MKLFTVKDFISYNNPCFSCGEKIIFTFGEAINPVIDGKMCSVQLITSYSSSLSIVIDLKTNKFQSSDLNSFKEYTRQKAIKLSSKCSRCGSQFDTYPLSFNFGKSYIDPCALSLELLRVKDKKFTYIITTIADGSLFQIQNSKTGEVILDLDVATNPITLSKLKTKEKMIHKLKTYIIFS